MSSLSGISRVNIIALILVIFMISCVFSEFLRYDTWGYYSERIFTPSGFKEIMSFNYYNQEKTHEFEMSESNPIPKYGFRHLDDFEESPHDTWSQQKAPFHLDILDGVLDDTYSFIPYRYPTTVIMIGKGVDEDHPEVQGRVSTCTYNYESTKIQNLTLPGRAVRLEHGTQIASLICGLACGISKATDIISLTLGGDQYNISGKKIKEALDYLIEASDLSYHELKIIVLSDYYYVKGGPFDTMIKKLREHNSLFIAHASMVDSLLFSKNSDIDDVFLFVSGIYRNGTRMGDCSIDDQVVDIFVATENILVPYTNNTAAPFGYAFRTHSELAVGIIAGVAAYEWAIDENIRRASQLKSKLLGMTKAIKGGPERVFVTF